jgi:peptidyl-prolyl cis-trans isomerase SurA
MLEKSPKSGILKKINTLQFLLTFLCFACFLPANAESRDIVDRVVAVVNDEVILLSDLNVMLNPFISRLGEYQYSQQQQEQLAYRLREEILNQLINEKLTDQQIKKHGIEISKKEVDNSIEQMKQANRLTDEDLRSALSEQGLSMEEFREKIREQILRSKLVNQEIKSRIVITREDIKRYYDQEYGNQNESKKYHLRSILMQVPARANEREKSAIENKMQSIHEKLEQGESFTDMAKIHSIPALASSGGYLGAFTLNTIAPRIRDAVADLKPGEFSPVLDTEQGYQIFFLDKIESYEGEPLEEVSAEIEEKLYNQIVDERFNFWLEDLRNRSHIKIIR